jgi:hypothetical protein
MTDSLGNEPVAEPAMDESNFVWVFSGTVGDGNLPHIGWRLQEQSDILTLPEARQRAKDLFTAAAIAEAEAAIFEGLADVPLAPSDRVPGYGFKAQAAVAANKAKMLDMAARMTVLLRTHRPPMPKGLEMIYGMNTKLPLLNVYWYGEPLEWDMQQAREHAIALLETAESAESDAFYHHFLKSCELSDEAAGALLREFFVFRQQNSLENLFQQTTETAPEDDR